MNTNNILSQIANIPQAIGERYYFYATDKGIMPTEPAEKHSIKHLSLTPKPKPILHALKRVWPSFNWNKYFLQWEAKEGDKPVLQIYLVQKDGNVPVDSEVFEAIITRLYRDYPKLKVLKQAPVGRK